MRKAILSDTKQLGDAGEMLVADKLTAAGTPSFKFPTNHRCFDLVTLARGDAVRVSVKSRRPTHPHPAFRFGTDGWDWLALVQFPESGDGGPRIWLLPRDIALRESTPMSDGERRIPHSKLTGELAGWENNYKLAVAHG